MNSVLNWAINKVSRELCIDKKIVEAVYKSYWKFIKQNIEALSLEGLTKEECSRQHPLDSVEIARRLVEDLPEKSADIIERHMWPAGHSKAPNSLEGVIVSVADKYAAVKDLVQGSEIRHTGIKNKVHDFFNGEGHTG